MPVEDPPDQKGPSPLIQRKTSLLKTDSNISKIEDKEEAKKSVSSSSTGSEGDSDLNSIDYHKKRH